ncbi:MAG: hypothetical protein AABY93_16745 [Bacteroidota bacterium]
MTEDNLRQATKEFFRCYWSIDNGEQPEWSHHWNFNGSIPNNNKRGCYVLFRNKDVVYVGIGIGKGTGMYQGCGLGFRLKKYWAVNRDKDKNTKYKPTSNWTELTSVMTIGFEEKHYPLAAALEIYLINKLNPPRNSLHK